MRAAPAPARALKISGPNPRRRQRRVTIVGMGKRLTLALAAFALIVVPLGAYVGGYFLLGQRFEYVPRGGPVLTFDTERMYPQRWMVDFFRPAARIEERIRGVRVEVIWRDADLDYLVLPTEDSAELP